MYYYPTVINFRLTFLQLDWIDLDVIINITFLWPNRIPRSNITQNRCSPSSSSMLFAQKEGLCVFSYDDDDAQTYYRVSSDEWEINLVVGRPPNKVASSTIIRDTYALLLCVYVRERRALSGNWRPDHQSHASWRCRRPRWCCAASNL